jgi:hypothetical protein
MGLLVLVPKLLDCKTDLSKKYLSDAQKINSVPICETAKDLRAQVNKQAKEEKKKRLDVFPRYFSHKSIKPKIILPGDCA